MATSQSTTVAPVEYRDIPGFPGYRVGSDGSVWSRRPIGGRGEFASEWRRLRTHINTHGYPAIAIRRDAAHKCPVAVHVFVMLAFVGPPPDGLECCHNDGDPLNSNLSNLRYDTHSANMIDRIRHGTANSGERNGRRKLTEAQVAEIRQKYAAGGRSKASIGRDYDVTGSTVGLIVRGVTWVVTPTEGA